MEKYILLLDKHISIRFQYPYMLRQEMLSVCNHKIIFDPLLTQNGIGTGSSGRKQRKIYPPNSVKQRKTEPKWLRFFFGTTYGPEGRGFLYSHSKCDPLPLRIAGRTAVKGNRVLAPSGSLCLAVDGRCRRKSGCLRDTCISV